MNTTIWLFTFNYFIANMSSGPRSMKCHFWVLWRLYQLYLRFFTAFIHRISFYFAYLSPVFHHIVNLIHYFPEYVSLLFAFFVYILYNPILVTDTQNVTQIYSSLPWDRTIFWASTVSHFKWSSHMFQNELYTLFTLSLFSFHLFLCNHLLSLHTIFACQYYSTAQQCC